MAKTISNQAIFGEYKNPEDKVTAALLQVLHYGGHRIVCSVFDDIDLPSNDINVLPQVQGNGSRPDGYVSCDCKYTIYIESKISRKALRSKQAATQLAANRKLYKPNDAQYVIYITPDDKIPNELQNVPEIIWTNWQTVVDRLKGYDTQDPLVKFLIEQFCLFVDHIVYQGKKAVSANSNSITAAIPGKDKRVIVVGGSWAEDVALNYGFYGCQEGRFFLPAKYMAFYHKNRIKFLFEIEGDPIESVVLDANLVGAQYFQKKDPNYSGDPCKYFKLKRIHEFNPEIPNDIKDTNGKPYPYTYKQRYTTYDAIMKAKKTSEL